MIRKLDVDTKAQLNSSRTTQSILAFRLLSLTMMVTVLVLFLLMFAAPAGASVEPGCKPFWACPRASMLLTPAKMRMDKTVAPSADTAVMQIFPVQQVAAAISALQANDEPVAPVLALGGGNGQPRCPCHPYCCV